MKLRIFSLLAAVLAAAAAIAEPRSLALIVQNHCSGGTEPPLAQLADWLVPALTTSDISIVIPANSRGKYQNIKPSGEKLSESSAKALAEDLETDGLLIAAVQRFAAKTLSDSSIPAHRISVSITLTLYNLGTGGSVCSVSLANWSKTIEDADMKPNGSLGYETILQETADKIAKDFLGKYDPGKWNPTPVKKVKVFFGCNVLGAHVKIDDKLYTSPVELEANVGFHNVEVSYPPYYSVFKGDAKFETDGQTYNVVLLLNELGEEQRNRALGYETKLVELKKLQLELEKTKNDNSIDYDKKKLALEREKKSIEMEQGERCELFKKQLALADAMLKRYKLTGATDDYVRRKIADGKSVFWSNSFNRLLITDGTAENVEFYADGDEIVIPSDPNESPKLIQRFIKR